jgi:hypothetical protein
VWGCLEGSFSVVYHYPGQGRIMHLESDTEIHVDVYDVSLPFPAVLLQFILYPAQIHVYVGTNFKCP